MTNRLGHLLSLVKGCSVSKAVPQRSPLTAASVLKQSSGLLSSATVLGEVLSLANDGLWVASFVSVKLPICEQFLLLGVDQRRAIASQGLLTVQRLVLLS